MILFLPPASGAAVPHTTDVLIGDGAGGISDGSLKITVDAGDYGTSTPVFHYTNAAGGNVFGIQNDSAEGFAAIPFRTSGGREKGAVGMQSDGSLVFLAATGTLTNPGRIELQMGYPSGTGDHIAYRHTAVGDTEFLSKTCSVTPIFFIGDAGQCVFHVQTSYGPAITRSDAAPVAWRVFDTDGSTEVAAFGAFLNEGNTYISYTGTLKLLGIGGGGETDLTHAGNLTLPGSLTIGGGAAITKVLTGTAALDFGSIAASDVAELTIGVTGAVAGDAVYVSGDNGPGNLIVINAWVSASDVITVRATNIDPLMAHDPSSVTYRAVVTKF